MKRIIRIILMVLLSPIIIISSTGIVGLFYLITLPIQLALGWLMEKPIKFESKFLFPVYDPFEEMNKFINLKYNENNRKR